MYREGTAPPVVFKVIFLSLHPTLVLSCPLSTYWVSRFCFPPFTPVRPRCCLQWIKLNWGTGSFPRTILEAVRDQQTVACGPSPGCPSLFLYVSGAKKAFYMLKYWKNNNKKNKEEYRTKPAKPKIFALGPFREKACWPLLNIIYEQCDQWVEAATYALNSWVGCLFWKLILVSQSMLSGIIASKRVDSWARKLKVFCRVQTVGNELCVYS